MGSADVLHRKPSFAVGVTLSVLAASAVAQPVNPITLRAVDVGVPTDGVRTMTGYRGYVLQFVSTIGPIRHVGLADGGIGRAIYGGLAQRWTDPTASGDYTVTSPGPFPDTRNDPAHPTELNFDSHFLFRPEQVVTPAPFEPQERAFGPLGFLRNDNLLLPGFNPIPSTPSVGYGTALYDQFSAPAFASLQADYEILPPFRSDVIDVAYVVANRGFGVGAVVRVEGSTVGYVVLDLVNVPVPEPAALSVGLLAVTHFLRHRPRREPCASNSNGSSRVD